jgi:8-hydroxy-5-deazaflavin:NADPH oxidoreductase
MKIAIFGTGTVGQTLADKLAGKGHDVMIGTRDPAATRARTEKDSWGNPPISAWLTAHPGVKLGTFAEAGAHGELAFNALAGHATLAALGSAQASLADKILVDISNPLDFSKGMPPSLFIANTDSLGEQVQKALPKTKVVKALNTVNAYLMVDPGQLAGGDHSLMICGDDAGAKTSVTGLLREQFGWKDIVDLGDITNARGTEMYLALWVRLWGALKTPTFSVRVVR